MVVPGSTISVPAPVRKRQPKLPKAYEQFIGSVDDCVNDDETAWFLTAKHFEGRSEFVFAWNEWEKQSLEGAGDDAEWAAEITAFWARHLPIFISVKNGYSYFALDETGNVVFGQEPEYEETSVVANSFEEFLTKISRDEVGEFPEIVW